MSLDIESTGLSIRKDEPMEIGIVMQDGKTRKDLQSYIKPTVERSAQIVDTCEVAKDIGEKKRGLKDVYLNRFEKMFDNQHNALGDAHAVFELFDAGWCALIGQPLASLFTR